MLRERFDVTSFEHDKRQGMAVDSGKLKGMESSLSLLEGTQSCSHITSACKSHPGVLTHIVTCGFYLKPIIISGSNDAKENPHKKAKISAYSGLKVE